jgi:crotonobetainyl-CoA:carnitine CoA-transferase CaiB-like acyl-CoA transferase
MQGVRVVELGFWVAGPSAAGILADWGADVVKLEPPDGDPFRALYLALVGQAMPVNPPFELDNRGKRSIALDLTRPEGRELAYRLIDGADVFVSNFRPEILERFGLDYPTLSRRNPRLVYGSVTGYGLDGPDRDRPAYDVGAFWSRAGIAAALTAPGGDPPMQRGAMGDHATGMTAAGGIAAALFAREKSGRGQLVSTSLLRVGVFTLGWDINSLLMLGAPTVPLSRATMPNPVINCFRGSDGKWFWLLGLEGDRHWPDLVRSVGKPEWLADPRFATIQARTANCGVLTAALDEVFATRPRAEWTATFDREGMWWAPLQSTDEVVRDPQAIAAGSFVDVPRDGAPPARMVATPLDFSDTRWEARAVAPELGQHTEELLLELGYDWDAIAAFKEKGVIP